MEHRTNILFILLSVISNILFSQRLFSQNSQIEDNLYFIKDEISGKYGGVNIYNDIVIPFEYDDFRSKWADMSNYHRFIVEKKGKKGVIDINNQVIIPFIYEWIGESGYGIYQCQDSNHKYGLIDSLGNKILPCEYDNLLEQCGKYLVVRKERNNYYGVFNLDNKEFALPCKYREIESAYGSSDPYKTEFLKLEDSNGKISIVRVKDLKQITKYKYDKIKFGEVCYYGYCFSGGLAIVKREGKYGAINMEGKEVVPVRFNCPSLLHTLSLELYQEDASAILVANAETSSGEKYSCYNVHGKLLYESVNEIYPLECGRAFWGKSDDRGYYLYNYDGKRLSNAPYYSSIYCTKGAYTIIRDNNSRLGLVSDNGAEIIACQYDDIKIRSGWGKCPIAMLKSSSGWQIYNLKKKQWCSQQYYEAYDISNSHGADNIQGSVIFVKNGGWGILDIEKCEMVVPCIYDVVGCNTHDLFFCKNNKYGFANLNGDITDLKYNSEWENSRFYLDKMSFEKQKPDVDTYIPVNTCKSEQTFAVIIANEKYSEANIPDVPFASNDGSVFREYCRKTLGIPNANIRLRENATLNQIRYELKWLKDVAEAYNSQAKIIFYYAGHGIPDEHNSESYLLPSDGFGTETQSAYSLNELFAQLGALPSKQVTVLIDACFSGSERNGKMLSSARSVAIVAKSGSLKGSMVVLSAAQADETAYQYQKKKHGMFSYFLLKKLQETKGDVSIEELGKYIIEKVQRCSIRENGKKQTPLLQVSHNLQFKTKDCRLN